MRRGVAIGYTLLTLAGCDREPASRALANALGAVNAADPSAWGLCAQLSDATDRGTCLVAASRARSDRVAACTQTPAPWDAECWFVYAEDLAADARWDEAIAACSHAGASVSDCARHVWWAGRTGSGPGDLRTRIVSALPMVASDLARDDDADLERLADDLVATVTAADAEESRRAWRERFQDERTVHASACPEEDRACVGTAVAVYTERWRRALATNPRAMGWLCTSGGTPGARLDAAGDPDLLAALATLRAERCDGTVAQD